MSERLKYKKVLNVVRRELGSGFAIVPITPDHSQILAATDHWDRIGRSQSYTSIYRVMVDDYVRRKT